jgi:hypothetical protein
MTKKEILNEVRKLRNDLRIDNIILEGKVKRNLENIVERVNALEQYLGISFEVEETPRTIKKGYKKINKNKKNK